MTPGALIRTTRERHGLTQHRLALRVGTKQSAISRLERDELSPSVETLQMLLRAMGEELSLEGRPVAVELTTDPMHRQVSASRSHAERLELAMSWNRLAGRLAAAGRQGRANG